MYTDRTDRGGETSGSDGYDGASTGGSVGVAEALAAEFEGLMDAAEVDLLRQKQQSMCVALALVLGLRLGQPPWALGIEAQCTPLWPLGLV